MTFDSIRPFVRDIMKAVDPELKMHDEPFNSTKVPSYQRNKTWGLEIGTATLTQMNQTQMMFELPIVIVAWVEPKTSANDSVDVGWKKAEAILKEATRDTRRLSQPYIKNVTPRDLNVGAFDATNENLIEVRVGLVLRVHQDTVR